MIYSIYCDNTLVYSGNIPSLAIYKGKYEAELNCIPYLEFSIYKNHPCYNIFNKMTSVVTLKRYDEEIFRGRVLNEETGLYGEKKIVCEGELSYLLDSIQSPYSFLGSSNAVTVENLFRSFINSHNGIVNSSKRFTVGNITVSTKNDLIMRSNSTYLNTYESIMQKLIESCGGVLHIRNTDGVRYIDYIDESTAICTQTIKFGENVFDIYKKIKGQDIFTGIVPLGATLNDNTRLRVTISDVNDGKNYLLNSTAVSKYGIILKSVIWEGISDKTTLKNKGLAYVNNAGIASENIELNAFDLSYSDKTIDSFNVGEGVRVVSDFHGINGSYIVRKIKIDLTRPEESILYLGNGSKSLTSKMKKSTTLSQSELSSFYENADSKFGEIFSCITPETDGITINGRIKQENGIAPVFNTGWSNYGNGYSAVKYYKDSCNMVHISGNANKSTDAGNVIFTLPEYYIPDETEEFLCASSSGVCIVGIDTEGNVSVPSDFNGTRLSLSGINFRTGG